MMTSADNAQNLASDPFDQLNAEQRAVFERLAQGKSNRVIAKELDVREIDVKGRISQMYRILKVTNRVELALKFARRRGHPIAPK